MLDPQVRHLLETGINTSCKLAIVLRFIEQSELRATASELATRVCRDNWSVQDALDELVEDGILQRWDGLYYCASSPDLRARLRLLQETHTSPLQRMELQRLLRDLERYAPYRKEFPTQLLVTRVA